MSESIRGLLVTLKAVAIYLAIGAVMSYIYYSLKRRDLFGGYIGGLVVGLIGALIGGFFLDKFFYDYAVIVLEFLSRGAGVNIIAGFIGAFAALYIMNRLNHKKERKKY
ncbi:MAG: hypothetical protein GY754_38580 [bacterium]|nr:hypothetical protein [bacterium]